MASHIAIVSREAVIINTLDQIPVSELIQIAVHSPQADIRHHPPYVLKDPLGSGVAVGTAKDFQDRASLFAVSHNK